MVENANGPSDRVLYKTTKTAHAMTLLEVMVVVIITAALGMIVILSFMRVLGDARSVGVTTTVHDTAMYAGELQSTAAGPSECPSDTSYMRKAVAETSSDEGTSFTATTNASTGPTVMSVAQGTLGSGACAHTIALNSGGSTCVVALSVATGTVLESKTIVEDTCSASDYLSSYELTHP